MRMNFENAVDIIYLLNVLITPFIGKQRKFIDLTVAKKMYQKRASMIPGTGEGRVKILFFNYLNYFFMLDFVPSLIGVIIWNRVINYHQLKDIVYSIKAFRLFTLARLYQEITAVVGVLSSQYLPKYPKVASLIPLIGVLSLFVYVLHLVAFVLVWRSLGFI